MVGNFVLVMEAVMELEGYLEPVIGGDIEKQHWERHSGCFRQKGRVSLAKGRVSLGKGRGLDGWRGKIHSR